MDTTTPTAPSTSATPGVATDALTLAPGRWELDLAHSNVGFAIRHLGVSKVRGAFRDVAAELVVGAAGEPSRLEVDLAIASIDTGNADRDAHVLSNELLDVERRPSMRYVATDLRGDVDDSFELDGELTIGDVTRSLTLSVEAGGLEVFPVDGRRHAGFEATGEIRRRDFGLSEGLLSSTLLGDVVKLELDVQFVEPAAEDAAA
jgi:polyisoprenoid-binding protein YceI